MSNEIKLKKDSVAEFKGEVIDILESYLDEKLIKIENEERDEYNEEAGYEDGENDVNIFGDDYDAIADEIPFDADSDPESISKESANEIAKSCVKRLQEILESRGSEMMPSDDDERLTTEIVSTFEKWDAIK